MSASSATTRTTPGSAAPTQSGGFFPAGRMFVNPLFDYLLIGGVLSLLAIPFLPPLDQMLGADQGYQLAALVLVANSAHFAASTVRLYTKKGMFAASPFHTMLLPLVFLLVVGAGVISDQFVGKNLFRLYLTWSPYHYAAQTFGLAMMYGHRSGSKLQSGDTRLLYWTAMLPFLYAFMSTGSSGISWFIPPEWFDAHPLASEVRVATSRILGVMTFAVPAYLFARMRMGGRTGLPLISYAILLSNGIWWIAFTYIQAFGWVTVAHSVQYLAIVLIFHVRESGADAAGTGGVVRSVLGFYAKCLVLGYLLFQVLPHAYAAIGFPLASSLLVVAAAINIHHFVVDRVIWRQRKDPNMQVVVR